MAPILFNAASAQEKKQFSFTFGKSRETSRWVTRRKFTFDQLASYLSATPQIGSKDGECYTPALFKEHLRKLEYATHIDVVVLDSDCGHDLSYIRQKVAALGWRAIIHSTYSHLTEETIIAASAFRKWEAENPGRNVGQYMIAKKGFLPNIMGIARILDPEGDGKNLVVRHAPCPKFRILLPLNKAWEAEEYETQELANSKWRERIGALAYALGLYHDQSCVDTSRLYYFPRVRDEVAREKFTCEVLSGEDCDLWGLPDAKEVKPAPGLFDNVVSLTPRTSNGLVEKKTYVNPETGEIFDLTGWAARFGIRFEIFDAIRARAPGLLSARRTGVKHHIYCPRSGDHMTGGVEGTGTYVVNASQLPMAGLPGIAAGFVIHCMHSGCAGVDRLDHIKALLDNGSLSTDDLTNPEFLVSQANSVNVDISKLLNKIEKKESGTTQTKQTQAEIEREGSNIAPYLYKDLPGMLGAMHKYILATSTKPQPALALGAALAFCAAAIGQRVMLQHFDTRPNIYILGVGVSGAGKERPMSACKRVAREAGLFSELIGVEEVASDTGIIASVINAPRQLMLVDEVSFLLNATSDPRAGAHLKNVVATMLKLYSSSSTTYQSKSYADTERTKTIDQPCVSFYGASTPRGLSDSLSSKDIESGLLSRMVVFDAGLHDPRISIPEKASVPQEIIQWLKAWQDVKPVPNPVAVVGYEAGIISPRVVMVTEEALEMAMTFEGEMHETKTKARERGKDALYVRAFENALKFALIRACAIWPVANAEGNGIAVDESALRVDAQTMRWAIDLSRATVERMDATTDEIADTPYQQSLKALRTAVRRAGAKGMTIRDLNKVPAGRMPARALNEALATLHDANEVRFVRLEPTGRGRPREAYVHKSFLTAEILNEEDDGGQDEEKARG
jgi:hypothetical protein